MQTLGKQIKEARKALNMTQNDVADKIGVTVQAISQWENDKTVPTFGNLNDLQILLQFRWGDEISGRDLIVGMHQSFTDVPAIRAPLVSWEKPETWSTVEFSMEHTATLPPDEFLEVRWKPIGDIYALKVRDGRMREDFTSGDIIIIDSGRAAEKGDFVVAECKGSVTFGRFFPLGTDKHRAPIFEIRFNSEIAKTVRVDTENPGRVIGTVREQRRFFRTS